MWPFIDYSLAKNDDEVPTIVDSLLRIPTWFARRWPDFLVIGAPKCGTSSLYQWMCQHPEFSKPLTKELHYYSIHYHRGTWFYRSYFPPRTDDRVTGEFSPSYYWHPLVPQRVKKDVPNVRIVMLMRDPVDRAYSEYWMQVRQNVEPWPWEWAIKYEPSRVDHYYKVIQDHPHAWSNNLSRYAYQLRSRYHLHVRRWLDTFPRDQLLFITLDELKKYPQETYDRVCEHVHLSPGHEPEFRHYNAFKGSYPEMDPSIRHALEVAFEEHNEALFKMLPDLDADWGGA